MVMTVYVSVPLYLTLSGAQACRRLPALFNLINLLPIGEALLQCGMGAAMYWIWQPCKPQPGLRLLQKALRYNDACLMQCFLALKAEL
jgi:hypothetical protein